MFENCPSQRNVSLLKIEAKSLRDGSEDICKDTESNLGPFAGFLRLKLSRSKLYFSFRAEQLAKNNYELELRNYAVCYCFFFPSRF